MKRNCSPYSEKEETAVLIVAIVAWMLRKGSRAIVLVLIFSIASRHGFVHALYMIYFMLYLLSHTIGRKTRQSLIVFCEVHFSLLYILDMNLISKVVEQRTGVAVEILSQLGLLQHTSFVEFLKIAALACFCSICNNGFDMFLSYSAVVQDSPFPPIGWNILKAGLKRSFLSSVYFSTFQECGCHNSSHDSEIALYINDIGLKIHSAYRSCGTYIVCLTVLLTIYLVTPNYASFGYLFFLLLWMNGRQLVGKTIRHLWFPLKLYAVAVFALIYCLSVFPSFKKWFSGKINLYQAFGYDPNASLLRNVWEPLAILIVIQLYSFERSLDNSYTMDDFTATHFGTVSIFKRLLIWHSEKILLLALFYASLSHISAFGFVYLLGMVISSAIPKSSRVASKFFLVYSGFVLMVLYLFQMWGEDAEMFPGQRNSYLSSILGLQMFKPGFFGLESGMRGEVLVIMACVLQYNVFHWLDILSHSHVHKEYCEEQLTSSRTTNRIPDRVPSGPGTCNVSVDVSPLLEKEQESTRNSLHYISDDMFQVSEPVDLQTESMERKSYTRTYSYNNSRDNSKENHKWNRRWVVLMRKERQEMQKDKLKLYMKYMLENIFSIFGLEINMIALVLASFAVLNVISLLYIGSLAVFVLIPRHVIRKLWPIFVLSFSLVLTLEYLSIWLNITSWKQQHPSEENMACHDCWKNSDLLFDYCRKCWLGTIVDDPRMLISYFMVFMLACFKFRADNLSGPSVLHMYQKMKQTSLLGDLSFDTKSMWTLFDYLRLYGYCHLLDLVLALIMITGTLEYDILHLGYLAFALAFFRMRLEILKKKNKIFKFLRMYNFAVIVFSLAYQSPFVGDSNEEKCETINYIYEVIGFYKYDYGFRITSRSALVEIIIFMLVSLQSYMFASQEFDYVAKYLHAEQLDGFVREQEKRASWKIAQLHHIRKSEEQKRLRNSQVEKMKSEMFSLQMQLHNMSMHTNSGDTLSKSEDTGKKSLLSLYKKTKISNKEENDCKMCNEDSLQDKSLASVKRSPFEEDSPEQSLGSPQESNELKDRSSSIELWDLEKPYEGHFQGKKNRLASAANLFGHGVSHVKSLGNKAVSNLVNYLNIKYEEPDILDCSSENDIYYELENQYTGDEPSEQTLSVQSSSEKNITQNVTHVQKPRISVIFYYMLAKIRSNNDIVCYCLFVLMFLWNFSLLSTVYLAALYLFALCVNTGPGYIFWVMMLVYSEVCILLQYLYQIIIQHCGFRIHFSFLKELGFPDHEI
ncbi:piezo-type mechanosensitive ion channel homolog [Apium graveolens]|uniref:piezo-type mechanosensitive ion channel homolog n=1 Tax=Apium graveolens TaxID=4045 RepID=UPI003D7AA42C